MILHDAARALGQMGDPRFLGVLARGVALTLALFSGLFWLLRQGLAWLLPETLWIPWIGEVALGGGLSFWPALLVILGASSVLMVPVASAFTSLFLDTVAEAVEARDYPTLPPAPAVPLHVALADSFRFLLVIGVANLLALVAYVAFAPFAPIIFIALNGYLLGREYFQLSAMRRLGLEGARQMRRAHVAEIWAAGALMAVPLTIPLLNLLVPILGAATFTHLFHRLRGVPPSY